MDHIGVNPNNLVLEFVPLPNTTHVVTNYSSTDAAEEPLKYWALFLFVFPVFTVFGNVLVCLSVYKEKTLHTVTNYFICSLAIADIMVAILVMPFAVYVEVNNSVWELGNALCDAWVAFDVMCCTSSILNLTAISVDRFIAVTRPIQYAKHKKSRRIQLTLALTWIVSIAVSLPIASGMNYTDRRAQTPWVCTFYNADFLIYSSMTSFYIPCILMIVLYWRTFRAIRLRAQKMSASRSTANRSPAKTATSDVGHQPTRPKINITSTDSTVPQTCRFLEAELGEDRLVKSRISDASIVSDASSRNEILPIVKVVPRRIAVRLSKADAQNRPPPLTTQFTNYKTINLQTPMATDASDTDAYARSLSCPECSTGSSDDQSTHVHSDSGPRFAPSCRRVKLSVDSSVDPDDLGHNKTLRSISDGNGCGDPDAGTDPDKHRRRRAGFRMRRAAVFNFSVRFTKQRNDKSSNKRERKATKTLAIVLGVFLFCWVPFFTINIINAVCIRYDLFSTAAVCNIHPMAFSLFVWLGYINSFLNPLIYTIFNVEFRKAFKKLLQEPC